MKTWTIALALAAALATSASASQDALPKEVAALQGTWVIVSLNDQSPADQGVAMSLSFTGNNYTQSLNGEIVETGTFKLDASKKPMALDFTIVSGDDAGKVQLGIVEMGDQMLTFGLAEPGLPDRPIAFANGGAAVVAIAKKAK
jgi:uncharacterized protein (TIGR03067 family)